MSLLCRGLFRVFTSQTSLSIVGAPPCILFTHAQFEVSRCNATASEFEAKEWAAGVVQREAAASATAGHTAAAVYFGVKECWRAG